jgi:hypothetical protein
VTLYGPVGVTGRHSCIVRSTSSDMRDGLARGHSRSAVEWSNAMSKSQDAKKATKKEPAKTVKEKKEAKKVKKEEKKRQQ